MHGQPEVGDVRLAQAVDQDVRRLDIAVHEPLGVCVMQRLGHLGDQPATRSWRWAPPSTRPASVDPSMYSITTKGGAVVDPDHVVDRHDRRVPQPSCGILCLGQGRRRGRWWSRYTAWGSLMATSRIQHVVSRQIAARKFFRPNRRSRTTAQWPEKNIIREQPFTAFVRHAQSWVYEYRLAGTFGDRGLSTMLLRLFYLSVHSL